MIRVWNNGDGIPVEVHKEEGVYVPELIFGHLLTSSNYDDQEKKVMHVVVLTVPNAGTCGWCPAGTADGPEGVVQEEGPPMPKDHEAQGRLHERLMRPDSTPCMDQIKGDLLTCMLAYVLAR